MGVISIIKIMYYYIYNGCSKNEEEGQNEGTDHIEGEGCR